MKETGMVRHVDMLGRFVLPKEIRDSMGLACGDALSIAVEDGKILLQPQKQQEGCIFCGGRENTVAYRGRVVCRACMEDFR